MRRREFITLLGSAAAVWPLPARAQQPAMPLIGFMSGRSAEDSVTDLAAFRRGLGESGLIEGKNVAIEFRWARFGSMPDEQGNPWVRGVSQARSRRRAAAAGSR